MGGMSMSDTEVFPEIENAEFSDLQLISHVRDAIIAVKLGNRENYDELVGYLHPKKYLNPEEAALLVTTLKALSGSVFYIDSAHHGSLLFAVSRISLWNHRTDVLDALLELIIKLATKGAPYIYWCLEMLVKSFVPPPNYLSDFMKQTIGVDMKSKVLSRVHAALKQIADLVNNAPFLLAPIVVEKMPNVFSKQPEEIVLYVENMLKLESGLVGEPVGRKMLEALVDRLIELDVQIGWDGILQEDAKGIFEMELEDIAEFSDEDEKYYDELASAELYNKNDIQGSTVVEQLDSLMVLTFLHLESCHSSGRLAEVFEVLLTSFQITVLDVYKSKFTQFVMFYACALDPEGCGLKFAMVLADIFCDKNPPFTTRMSAVAYLASYLSRAKFLSAAFVANIIQRLVDWCFNHCKSRDFGMNSQTHQVFYSGCQAIMYILCFRMRSLLDVPRLKFQLLNMPMEQIWKHKSSPLKVCLPTVVEEFFRQAKAAQLFMTSESFIFNDLLESDLSKCFGGMDRLDMFFPFDPLLLKKSESYIKPHFVRWSRVRTTYDTEDNDEVSDSDSESEESVDDFVERNVKNMFDNDMITSFEKGPDFVADLNKMSITPQKSLKFFGVGTQLKRGGMRMPARIRPSTSPDSL